MTGRGAAGASLLGWTGSRRQPVVTVIVLGAEYSGALAYALEYALFRPAGVQAVRVAAGPGPAQPLPMPIPVRDLVASPADALARISSCSECMVAQHAARGADGVLVDLRRTTHSPLIEVDRDGAVVRVSEPGDRPMSTAPPAAC